MPMPRVSAFLGLSLDGFIAGEGGELDWLIPFQEGADAAAYEVFMARVDTVLLGRETWETVRQFEPWPYPHWRVVVLTHRPIAAEHGESTASGPIGEVLARLGDAGAHHVYVDGGETVRQALAADVVDALTLTWVPLTLGAGRPLFGAGVPSLSWTVRAVRPSGNGLVQVAYERNRTSPA